MVLPTVILIAVLLFPLAKVVGSRNRFASSHHSSSHRSHKMAMVNLLKSYVLQHGIETLKVVSLSLLTVNLHP